MPVLTRGDSGRAVRYLNARLGLDGDTYTDATSAAVKRFQFENVLAPDGAYGPLTNAAMVKRPADAMAQLAATLGCEEAAIGAAVRVETQGAGFLDDGRPKILLERHYVWRLAGPTLRPKLPPDLCNPTPGGYLGSTREWDRYERLVALTGGEALAASCVSWGLPQIMGANYAQAGFPTVLSLATAMARDEMAQLRALQAFILHSPALLSALRNKDWHSFAVHYNGPAQKGYDERMAAAYNALKSN
ncbi:hypothetical protein 2B_00047 [Ralstonia phage Bakoly]|uniref:N-acetylmuramidase domain-containing protein n=2 Tax=Bakolyvirus bakoly TaxID=2846039 RepID=A0A7G5BB50_9CAUD|nr:endolysin [Ralstonia phage Bakoly]QMV32620.1 hypothetical protein 2B_00047 [Ralstonia phage Bakoly]QMV33523.1 hypothetical protein 30B_00016 [Ralstonia phage Jenny]